MNNAIHNLKLVILLIGACTLAPNTFANIVTNGGFESGLSGWTCTGFDYCTTSFGGQSGASSAITFDNSGYGELSQTLSTDTGTLYDVSFWWRSSNSTSANELGITFDSSSVGGLIGGVAPTIWTNVTTSFTATSALTTMSFWLATNSGTGVVYLDEVVVTAVPAPITLGLLGLGLLGLGLNRKRQQA